MPGAKRPPDGHVSMMAIAGRLGVDRRVLKRLYERDEISGVRAGGVIWLEHQALAAYLWSRPRCVWADCDRRVIGEGPGCDRHRRIGRRRTAETRRRISEAQGGQRVPRTCEQCRERFEISAAAVSRGRGRFCSRRCSTRWRNAQEPSGERQGRLSRGNAKYRAMVERLKLERRLLDVDELLKRLRRAGVPRSASAVAGHVGAGLLEPERGLGFAKPQLFAEAAVDAYIAQLRDYPDGRLLRYDAQPFRGQWHEARHASTAGHGVLNAPLGRKNVELAAAKGKKVGRPRELDGDVIARILEMDSRGRSQRTIAQTCGIGREQVRGVLRQARRHKVG